MNRLIEQHYAAFVSRESNNPGDRDLEREYILYEAGYKANKSRHSKEVIFIDLLGKVSSGITANPGCVSSPVDIASKSFGHYCCLNNRIRKNMWGHRMIMLFKQWWWTIPLVLLGLISIMQANSRKYDGEHYVLDFVVTWCFIGYIIIVRFTA